MARVALVTGGAKRLGATTCRRLHQAGYDLVIHYLHSADAAQQLVDELNQIRANSATHLAANLAQAEQVRNLAQLTLKWKNRLDLLVNNASRFYPTSIADSSDDDWAQLIGTNLQAPFLLCQQLAPALQQQGGAIVNLVDIYAEKPLLGSPLYSISKAALVMLTKSLARELAPKVRVNAVAPGAILPPLAEPERAEQLVASIPLARTGTADDIANTVCWLACDAGYINGQIIQVDGGRSLAFADA